MLGWGEFPLYSWARRKCPGEGCENTVQAGQELCTACRLRRDEQQREDARWTIYALEGIKKLRRYLANQAAFDKWLRDHERE